jgi:thiamine-monophosphate kinase
VGEPARGEFDLIAALRRAGAPPPVWLCRGVGDDAALLQPPAGEGWRLILSVDSVVDGVHFQLGACGVTAAGRKAVHAALSDVAAMGGGEAGWILAAVTLDRDRDPAEHERLLRAIQAAAEALGFVLVGGDIVAGAGTPTTISITVGAWTRHPVQRAGARPGDRLLVSGQLGGSAAGHHLTFTPRLELARELLQCCRPSAMIDVSDGLAADLGHLCEESGVGARLEADAIPLAPAAGGNLERALFDGEDYELLAAVPATAATQVPGCLAGTPVTWIGEIEAEPGLRLVQAGACAALVPRGHDHLRPPCD